MINEKMTMSIEYDWPREMTDNERELLAEVLAGVIAEFFEAYKPKPDEVTLKGGKVVKKNNLN